MKTPGKRLAAIALFFLIGLLIAPPASAQISIKDITHPCTAATSSGGEDEQWACDCEYVWDEQRGWYCPGPEPERMTLYNEKPNPEDGTFNLCYPTAKAKFHWSATAVLEDFSLLRQWPEGQTATTLRVETPDGAVLGSVVLSKGECPSKGFPDICRSVGTATIKVPAGETILAGDTSYCRKVTCGPDLDKSNCFRGTITGYFLEDGATPPPPAVVIDTSDPVVPPLDPDDIKLSLTIGNVPVEDIVAIPLPKPGEPALELSVSLRAIGPDGKGLRLLRADLGLTGAPYLRLAPVDDFPLLDASGERNFRLRARFPTYPEDYLKLSELPISSELRLLLSTEDGTRLIEKTWPLKPNLALFTGTTLGVDMEPQKNGIPPDAFRVGFMLGAEGYPGGGFAVLMHPIHPGRLVADLKTSHRLFPVDLWWSQPRLLKFGTSYRMPEGRQTAMPGDRIDLGGIEVLTPQEHEERVHIAIAEFIQSMPINPKVKAKAQADLKKVTFRYDGSTNGGAHFQENRAFGVGEVVLGGTREEYWSDLTIQTSETVLVTVLHELGHFMHYALVEKHPYVNLLYAKHRGAVHSTWKEPEASWFTKTDIAQRITSFNEATAEFFALLVMQHWKARQPAFKQSPHSMNGYLDQFLDDSMAMTALGTYGNGSKVEGVQARFLVALYGARAQSDPARVFADYLFTMLQYAEDKGTYMRHVRAAARSMPQWIWTKGNIPSKFGLMQPGDIAALAARYRMGLDGPAIATLSATERGTVAIVRAANGTADTVRFDETPTIVLDWDAVVEVQKGAVILDASSSKQRSLAGVAEGARFRTPGPGRLVILLGSYEFIDKMEIETPSATVTANGTVYALGVSASGALEAAVFDGAIMVQGAGDAAPVSLQAGQGVSVDPAGRAGMPGSARLGLTSIVVPDDLPPLAGEIGPGISGARADATTRSNADCAQGLAVCLADPARTKRACVHAFNICTEAIVAGARTAALAVGLIDAPLATRYARMSQVPDIVAGALAAGLAVVTRTENGIGALLAR